MRSDSRQERTKSPKVAFAGTDITHCLVRSHRPLHNCLGALCRPILRIWKYAQLDTVIFSVEGFAQSKTSVVTSSSFSLGVLELHEVGHTSLNLAAPEPAQVQQTDAPSAFCQLHPA
jgi:hypothetical protein